MVLTFLVRVSTIHESKRDTFILKKNNNTLPKHPQAPYECYFMVVHTLESVLSLMHIPLLWYSWAPRF